MTEPPPFSLDVRQDATEVVVAVHGELDVVTAPALRTTVAEQLPSRVVLDLGGVAFIDSSGIAALDALLREAAGHGAELVVVREMPAPVARVLELTGMMGVLRLEDRDGSS